MRKLLTITAVSLMACSAFAAGEVWRWKDAQGQWHYSDQPRPGAELVRGPQRPASTPAPTYTPPAAASVPLNADGSQVVSDTVAAQVRAEADAIKSEQCKKAEEAYQNALQARRIYRTDAQGNRTYLTDAEIDATRLEARGKRDLACGGA